MDLTREVLGLIGMNVIYPEIQAGYENRSISQVSQATRKMHEFWADLHQTLSTDRRFLLGLWLLQAREKAANSTDGKDEADLYEYNWRNQVGKS